MNIGISLMIFGKEKLQFFMYKMYTYSDKWDMLKFCDHIFPSDDSSLSFRNTATSLHQEYMQTLCFLYIKGKSLLYMEKY